MRISAKAALIAISLALSVCVLAKVRKGDAYVLAVPLEALQVQKMSAWSGNPIYLGEIKVDEKGVLINGSRDWLSAGYPSGQQFKLKRIIKKNRTKERGLQLKCGSCIVRLYAKGGPEVQSAMDSLLIPAGDKEAIKESVNRAFTAMGDRLFVGDLKEIPPSERIEFLQKTRDIGVKLVVLMPFKGKSYLTLFLGTDIYTYNSIKLNQSQRVARVIARELLDVLKRAEPLIRPISSKIYGVEARIQIPWRNFSQRLSLGGIDSLELYVPCNKLKEFADNDLTSQEMINASVVLVDGNRTAVDLSQQ